ncbi:Abi family protein [Ruegeria sp. SCPT10]|uniref:Abi family protein n=1 Tax=Ruegeria sp. SCP10 TaxID=3141377 RepID=UPI003336BD1A
MIERGLVVKDEDEAKHYLHQIGYYRFCGYTLPFQKGGDGYDRHEFRTPVEFGVILDRYVFDRKLRLLLLDAIERIEVSFRAALSNSIAQRHTPHWYQDATLFEPTYEHAALITELKRQIVHNPGTPEREAQRDVHIKHYYDTYNDPDMPPCWMVFETISFRTISRIFEGLYKSETTEVCNPLRVNHETLGSWMHSISYVRNLCAHHKRVWNKTLTIKPAIAKKHKTKFQGNTKIYGVMVVIQIILEQVAPDNTWAERLSDLLEEHPDVPLANMGVPDNWRDKPFWGLA